MLLVIGLDGATFDLLTPWMEAGHLPTLARLVKTGVSGPLHSTMPPITAPAWATFMTGKNPGQHGVFDFFKPHTRHLDVPEMVTMDDIDGRPFWDYLSDAGLKVGIMNVPITYPPRSVNGFLVPGLLSPDNGATTFPTDFLTPYTDELGAYRLTPDRLYRPDKVAEFVTDLQAVTATQINYALRIAQDHPVDFLMVHFLATDIAQHKLWRYLDSAHPWYNSTEGDQWATAVVDIFAQIDAAIDQLLTILPDETAVIVMSDHGFGAQHQTVNLNNFFIQTGLMTLKQNAAVRLRAWAAASRLKKAALKLAQKAGRSHLLSFADVDWTRTIAYSRGHMGQVYLNVQGRGPQGTQGVVAPDEYLAIRERVVSTLQTLGCPQSQRPLIDRIIPCEEAGSGPYMAIGADLYLVMDNCRTVAYPMFAADGGLITQQPWGDSGNHRQQGIFIAAGGAFGCGTLTNAHLADVAPTILHLLGVAIPDDMDGRLLTDALDAQFAQSPIKYQPAQVGANKHTHLSPTEQADVAAHLRALGYVGGPNDE